MLKEKEKGAEMFRRKETQKRLRDDFVIYWTVNDSF